MNYQTQVTISSSTYSGLSPRYLLNYVNIEKREQKEKEKQSSTKKKLFKINKTENKIDSNEKKLE